VLQGKLKYRGARATAPIDGDVGFMSTLCSKRGAVFELGCWTGRIVLALAEKGWIIAGVDISGGMLIAARKSPASARRAMSLVGLVSRVPPVQTALRNCTRDEGGPFEFGNQVLISSHRKLLSSKATVVNVAETSGHDLGRHG
jgi:SAM-dependent methyltransferase